MTQFNGAKVFSKLDVNCGFWLIALAETSQHLTTITPYGRYCFNKLPFGILGEPEHLQRMSNILQGQEGVLCHVDDVLVFAPTQQEHDIRLCAAVAKIQAAELTLHREKCEFNKERLTFLDGISADPEKDQYRTNYLSHVRS